MTVRRYFWLLVVVLGVGYLLTGVAQVRPGEKAVVRRFGRVVAKPGPGLWVGLPWGMDRVDRVPINMVRRVAVGFQPDAEDSSLPTPPGQLLTGDQNLVNVQVLLDYDVQDEVVEDYLLSRDRVDGLIARVAESALTEWVGGHGVDEVLLTGKAAIPAWLVARTQERLKPYRLGVSVQAANVAYLLPPAEVKPAFDKVTQAQAAIRTSETNARQKAARTRNDARIDELKERTAAVNYADGRRKLARAEADAFVKRLEQYQRLRRDNPDILVAIWWDEMGKLFGKMQTNGRVDLLDNHLGPDGLDITQFGPRPKKR